MFNLVDDIGVLVNLWLVNKKTIFTGKTLQKTPSEKHCLIVFIRIFVNQLLVERNHSLTG